MEKAGWMRGQGQLRVIRRGERGVRESDGLDWKYGFVVFE